MPEFRGVEHYESKAHSAAYRFPVMIRDGGTNAIANAYAQDILALVGRIKELEGKKKKPLLDTRIKHITGNLTELINSLAQLRPDLEVLEKGEPANMGWHDIAYWLEDRKPVLDTLISIARENAETHDRMMEE